jgi:RND family efflux transporter MFP subunit
MATAEDLSRLRIDKSATIAGRPRRRRKRLVIILVLAALILAAWATGVFTPPVSVKTATVGQVYPSQAFTVLNASGYVVAQRKSALASKITGRLIWLGVEEGNRVKRGEIVGKLESEDAKATRDQAAAQVNAAIHNLEQANAELSDATISMGRAKNLISKGYIAQSDFDTALARYNKAVAATRSSESAVKAAKAALESADVSVEYTLIRAPFDAVVLTKNADIGDIVTPIGAAASAQASIVSIADMSSLQVEADVSESNLEQVKAGQPCEIQLDAVPETRFKGKVHMVVPTADRTKATVMVKVAFLDKDPRILPEMSAKVAFLSRPANEAEQRPRVAINQSALSTRNGKTVIFVQKENRVVETQVVTGERLGDMTEIRQGVKSGDKVVINPTPKLKNGSKIAVAE